MITATCLRRYYPHVKVSYQSQSTVLGFQFREAISFSSAS
jgi:hypothetical protein